MMGFQGMDTFDFFFTYRPAILKTKVDSLT